MVRSSLVRFSSSVLTALFLTGGASQGETPMSDALQAKALTGDNDAQRQLAQTYRTGPGPAPALACAWRIVIGGSGHPAVTQQDVENRKRDCESLDPAQQRAATTEAKALFQRIPHGELVLPADF